MRVEIAVGLQPQSFISECDIRSLGLELGGVRRRNEIEGRRRPVHECIGNGFNGFNPRVCYLPGRNPNKHSS